MILAVDLRLAPILCQMYITLYPWFVFADIVDNSGGS